jgi:hypothetical protein
MSLALETRLSVEKDFAENREVMLAEAKYQFPNETDENAFNMLQRKYIDDEITEKVSTAFGQIVDMNNGIQPKDLAEYFLGGLMKQHRHLQGEFWNTIIHLMKKYANAEDRHFDGRNELARKMCAQISKEWI